MARVLFSVQTLVPQAEGFMSVRASSQMIPSNWKQGQHFQMSETNTFANREICVVKRSNGSHCFAQVEKVLAPRPPPQQMTPFYSTRHQGALRASLPARRAST